jgi:hypothetical protein
LEEEMDPNNDIIIDEQELVMISAVNFERKPKLQDKLSMKRGYWEFADKIMIPREWRK